MTKDSSKNRESPTGKRAVLLSTACFPPIHYLLITTQYDVIYIEQHENFIKQTFRNRYTILAANGPVSLIVPVVKGRGKKIRIKDLQISYDTEWQRNHWRTLFSAYNSSPFFEYYKDELSTILEKRYPFLLDLNLMIHDKICEWLELDNNLVLTGTFENVPEDTLNLREAFSPKPHKNLHDPNYQPCHYTQVFSEKFGFVPGLSILDLVFNEGPNSYSILQKSTLFP